MKNILVVNVNWIGDVIFSSPIFKALKDQYPEAKISCLAVPRVKDVLESIGEIDDIILYDERGRDRFLLGKLRIIKKIRQSQFDAVFLLHRSWTRALLVYLARIPIRVGYPTKKRGMFLTHHVSELKGVVHRSDHYLNVIESFGVKVRNRTTYLEVSDETQNEINGILRNYGINDDKKVIVCHVGANWKLKRWPAENFARLIDELLEDKSLRVVIPGTKEDKTLADKIVGMCQNKPVVLAGQTNLKQLMGLMKRAQYVVSNDSGPLHVASSLGTETIGIFGPTKIDVTGPRGVGKTHILQRQVGCNNEACYFLQCLDNICMQAVTVRDVTDVIKRN